MRGFTLLFASLIVSLILSVGLAIAHITLTEFTLSSAGRDSQFAFYNADSGLECALYYENNIAATDEDKFFPYYDGSDIVGGTDADVSSLYCGEAFAENVVINEGSAIASTTTSFDIETASGSCFSVIVEKRSYSSVSTDVYMESRGYSSCNTASPRRVERGLYTTFVD